MNTHPQASLYFSVEEGLPSSQAYTEGTLRWDQGMFSYSIGAGVIWLCPLLNRILKIVGGTSKTKVAHLSLNFLKKLSNSKIYMAKIHLPLHTRKTPPF